MIYETKGRAREFFELAANLYTGCEHACVYCYGADVTHTLPDRFFTRGVPRPDVLNKLEKDAARLSRNGETRHVLLSFVTDPYQPAEIALRLTRRAIEILHAADLAVAILTKGGYRATRDFDLLGPADLYGATLTFMDPHLSKIWEPRASLPIDRMLSLKAAKDRGIGTWVSCEPVIDYTETLAVIKETAPFVDVFKVGTLNYSGKLPRDLVPPPIDWKIFAQEVVGLLDRLGANYYIKKDLARYLGKPDGITVGQVPK